MRFGSLLTAFFCLVSTISGPEAFAVGSDLSKANQAKKLKVLSMVRLENNQVKCVQYAENVQFDETRLQIPLCASKGVEAEENQAAMNLAKSNGEVRTAAVSYIASALFGCMWGVVGSLGGKGGQLLFNLDTNHSDAKGALVGTAIGTAATAGSIASMDPTGHVGAGVVGALLCGGGISYIVYLVDGI